MKKGITDKNGKKKLPGLIFETTMGNKKRKRIVI